MSEDALRKTWEHIDLVQKLLMSAQIELMKRQAHLMMFLKLNFYFKLQLFQQED